MNIVFHEDDPRAKASPDFAVNKGSFSTIIMSINKSLSKMGLLAENEEMADIVGFSSGIKLDFGFSHKKRVFLGAWECQQIPRSLINERRHLEKTSQFNYFGISKQVSDAWGTCGFKTPVCDIGVDSEFWKRQNPKIKNDKFTILSVTSCNFRSGINQLINAYVSFAIVKPNESRLIIKDTDNRNVRLPAIIESIKSKYKLDITYICERWDDFKIRNLYEMADLLVYIPINTSAGLPILEAASMELPCIVTDYCPTNIYPSSKSLKTHEFSISESKREICYDWGLPYTFPEGWLNEETAIMNGIFRDDLSISMHGIKANYDLYLTQATLNRGLIERNWTWDIITAKLVKQLKEIYG